MNEYYSYVGLGHGFVRHFRNAHLLHFQLVAGQHFQPDAVALNHLADMRNVAQPFRHQAADGGGLGLLRRPELQQIVQTVQIQAAGHHETAVGLLRTSRSGSCSS